MNLLPYGVQENDTEGRITFANPAVVGMLTHRTAELRKTFSDFDASYSAVRSKSDTAPIPSQRGHMPPVMLKLRRSFVVRPPFSSVTAPAPLTEATLKEKACAGPM